LDQLSLKHTKQLVRGAPAYTCFVKTSKSAVDKAGRLLAKASFASEADRDAQELVLNEYRLAHLQPLTATTLALQRWLDGFKGKYYIAQRLKRKPQIIRKLSRFSVRLSQLQDIGGARIVVPTNADVDAMIKHLRDRLGEQEEIVIDAMTDYRTLGREDSGYRATHLILSAHGRSVELQLRSEAQHYWAEQIERTSVIYGHHLKELEGDASVLRYFKLLSDVFYELESGREPPTSRKIELDRSRDVAETVIKRSDRRNVFSSSISEGTVKAMLARHSKRPGLISNWIMVFNWNDGSFVYFEPVDRDPERAMAAYTEKESQFPAGDGFEVVMVGSSDPSMIRHTHSHYFGLETYDNVLETLKESIVGITKRLPIGLDALSILRVLVRRKHWSAKKMVSRSTLKNHFCQSVEDFDGGLAWLFAEGLVIGTGADGVYLNIQHKARIEDFL
jgi:hypothetical protein